MAVVIPFILNTPLVNPTNPNQSTQIVWVSSLYAPVPSFQYGQDWVSNWGELEPIIGNNMIRTTVPSFGFPNSTDIAGIQAPNSGHPVPKNAYALVLPSTVIAVDGTHSNIDTTSCILLVDVGIIPIEPGYSRLRVDYYDAYGNPQSQYFDVPFYQGWDVTPLELQRIVEWNEGAFDFIQAELTNIEKELAFLDSHMFLKGISVSGTMTASEATQNVTHSIKVSLPPGTVTSHSLPKLLNYVEEPKSNTSSLVYAGQTFSIDLGVTAVSGDTLNVSGVFVKSTLNGTKVQGTAPSYIPTTVTLPVKVVNKGLLKTAPYNITFSANPHIISCLSLTGVGIASPGDQFILTGTDFTNTQGTVTFTPNVSAAITTWTNTSIIGTVPNNAQSGKATVSINGQTTSTNFLIFNAIANEGLTVTPNLTTLSAGQTNQYTATYQNQTIQPTWSIQTPYRNIGAGNLAYGTVTTGGLYTAPTMVTEPLPVGIMASYMTPLGAAVVAEASAVLVPTTPTLTISPSSTILAPGYAARFQLLLNGNPVNNNNVEWFVNGLSGGNDSIGIITPSGLYQAPLVQSTLKAITLTATTSLSGSLQSAHTGLRIQPNTVIPHNILGKTAPSNNVPIITYVGSACPSQAVTINGKYWTSDMQVFAVNDNAAWKLQGQIVTTDNVNYSLSAIIPHNYSVNGGPFTIYVKSPSTQQFSIKKPTLTNQLIIDKACLVKSPTTPGPSTLPPVQHDFIPPIMPPKSGCAQLTVSPSTQNVGLGASFQFTAIYDDGNGTVTSVSADHWLVNDINGGAPRYGSVNGNGLYTAPSTPPQYSNVKVSAFLNTPGGYLEGYSVVTLIPIPQQTPACNVAFTSQLNIFMGDGRCGYVPVGTTATLYPGQYLAVQYIEILDSNFRAIINQTDYVLGLYIFNATDPDLSNSIYNGTLRSNGDGTYTFYQYILLGICDPVNGVFNEMWDSIQIINMSNQHIPSQAPCAHGMVLSPSKEISIENYAKKKLKKFKSSSIDISEHIARPTSMWSGSVYYENEELHFETPLSLHVFDGKLNIYKEVFKSDIKSIKIKTGETLILSPDRNFIVSNDNLINSSNTYVVGTIVNNRFISTESLITIKEKINVKEKELPKAVRTIIKRMKEARTQ